MTAATLQHLLITLLETGREIAGDANDPMHAALRAVGDIDAAVPNGDAGVLVTTVDRRRLTISIAEVT